MLNQMLMHQLAVIIFHSKKNDYDVRSNNQANYRHR